MREFIIELLQVLHILLLHRNSTRLKDAQINQPSSRIEFRPDVGNPPVVPIPHLGRFDFDNDVAMDGLQDAN